MLALFSIIIGVTLLGIGSCIYDNIQHKKRILSLLSILSENDHIEICDNEYGIMSIYGKYLYHTDKEIFYMNSTKLIGSIKINTVYDISSTSIKRIQKIKLEESLIAESKKVEKKLIEAKMKSI